MQKLTLQYLMSDTGMWVVKSALIKEKLIDKKAKIIIDLRICPIIILNTGKLRHGLS